MGAAGCPLSLVDRLLPARRRRGFFDEHDGGATGGDPRGHSIYLIAIRRSRLWPKGSAWERDGALARYAGERLVQRSWAVVQSAGAGGPNAGAAPERCTAWGTCTVPARLKNDASGAKYRLYKEMCIRRRAVRAMRSRTLLTHAVRRPGTRRPHPHRPSDADAGQARFHLRRAVQAGPAPADGAGGGKARRDREGRAARHLGAGRARREARQVQLGPAQGPCSGNAAHRPVPPPTEVWRPG
jgi:hypothetical protein